MTKMRSELDTQLQKTMTTFASQIRLHEDMGGGALGDGAIEFEANLEKLTSPTVWTSDKGKVELKHLDVPTSTRRKWTGNVVDGNLVYTCKKGLPEKELRSIMALTTRMLEGTGAQVRISDGAVSVTIPQATCQTSFNALSEEKIMLSKHADTVCSRLANKMGLLLSETVGSEAGVQLRHLKPVANEGTVWKTAWSAEYRDGGVRLSCPGNEENVGAIRDYFASIGCQDIEIHFNDGLITIEPGVEGTIKMMKSLTEESLFNFKHPLV